MNEDRRRTLKLQTGAAMDSQNLSMVFSALEMGDPYSIILTYDKRLGQPWGRVDVQRDVYGLVPDIERRDPAYYYALSNHGDVYHVGPEGATRETIPGAGMPGDAPDTIGPVYRLAWTRGRLHALGGDNLIFRRDPDGWRNVSPDISGPETFQAPSWGSIVDLEDGRHLLAGRARAVHPTTTRALDWSRNGMPEMRAEEFLAAINADQASHAVRNPIDPLGLLFAIGANGAEPLDFTQKGGLSAALRVSDGTIWVTGRNGQILRSGDGMRFEGIEADPLRTYGAMAEAPGGIVVISDQGLWLIRDGGLTPLRPRVKPERAGRMVSPASVAGVGGGVFVFDHNHGAMFWDGEQWDHLDVPPDLLRRIDHPAEEPPG